MSSGLHMQQALDKCTRGSPSVSGGPRFVSASLPCTGPRACVQPPPAATGSQKSQLLGLPCQLRTSVPAGVPTYLPDQAASSVFARGGAKGETEALQNAVATVTRHWRGTMGDIAFRAPATLRTAAGQQRQKRPEFELQSRAT